jgi:Hsp20/alpha crystallin family
MRTVKIRLQEADLSDEMAAMRSWLDRNGFDARTFNCGQSAGEVVLSVGFMSDAAADAFAARFDVTRCHPPSARQHRRSGCTLGQCPLRSGAPKDTTSVQPFDRDKVSADFSKGVLTITLPKTPDARKQQKKIEVESA